MNYLIRLIVIVMCIYTPVSIFGQQTLPVISSGQNIEDNDFEKVNQSSEWQLKFEDSCTENWQSKWFLDGLRATVNNTKRGMVFSAGLIKEDACHSVLWTKESFKGDVKIEYEYTRTDNQIQAVNILYIQATGTGIEPYSKDIAEWNDLRIIPTMSKYFKNMNLLHISYAAYNFDDSGIDYIRVRQYPVAPGQRFGKTTEILPASFDTGLFIAGVTYKITVVKTDGSLYFKVVGPDDSKLFLWDISNKQQIAEGRIGLRHMFTRSAMYSSFKIYTR